MVKTLERWERETGIERGECGAATYVMVDQLHPKRSELFSLADFGVSSVSGLTIWLFERSV
jgi:hypothetical protein